MCEQEGIRECGQLADIDCGRVSVEEDRYGFPLSLTHNMIDENVENSTGFRLEYNPLCSALDV
jgi:hypothetical protein